MSDWADWLITHGQADAQMVAEAERVLDAAALGPGDTVLDVGAGLGLLTLAAHERIGDGWVIAVDPSVGALEGLLRLAHEANSNGVMYLVGDAEVLPLPDASVDAVVLRSVLVHVSDVERATAELVRVLRPGGRLSLREPLDGDGTSIAAAVDWSALGELGDRVTAAGDEAAAGDPPTRLDPVELATSLEAAGFDELEWSVEDPGEDWVVTEASVDSRLDARAAPDRPTLREHWHASFDDTEVEGLIGHLRSLAGTTVTFRRPQLFLRARRPGPTA